MLFGKLRLALPALVAASVLAACGGGGSDDGGVSPPPPPPPPGGPTGAFKSQPETSLFLSQAAFGPRSGEIETLTGSSASQWFLDQLDAPPSYLAARFEQHRQLVPADGDSGFLTASPTILFWENAISAPDQVRQRMAFALSQILVVSGTGGVLRARPEAMVYYQDRLIEHAFGNYRDLLEAVTYSPAMGYYLTYLGSKKEDPETGRMPDENYARELLQLFAIGVVEIDGQGRPVTDAAGRGLELFDNTDITGLARVFTGFRLDAETSSTAARIAALSRPLVIEDRFHSTGPKSFLETTIPAGTSGPDSVDMALDHIMAQPTMGPFLARQLIQRFVTSAPSPAYVGRVASAFDRGRFQLPNAVSVGQGRRGDLAATLAAVLFDPEARDVDAARASQTFGKVREPVLRVAHWARAFDINGDLAEYAFEFYDTRSSRDLGQHPYQAPSVFNFYRPGYVAPGAETGAAGLTMPELQIFNTASTPGYVNFIADLVLQDLDERDVERIDAQLRRFRVALPAQPGVNAFVARYQTELELVATPEALIDHLDLMLTAGAMSEPTRALILEHVQAAAQSDGGQDDALRNRVQEAVLMVMTSPDYLVQR